MKLTPVTLLVTAVLMPLFALGQSMTTSIEALEVIGDFTDRLCLKVPLKSHSQQVELTGSAKAELEGVVKKLADLGVSGTAKYESAESQNVLQKDLAEVLKDSRACRLKIWDDLKGKFDIGYVGAPVTPSRVSLPIPSKRCIPASTPLDRIRARSLIAPVSE